MTEAEEATVDGLWESTTLGHACEAETSLYMACSPGTTRLELAAEEPVEPQGRFQHLVGQGIHNGLWWYADFPENVVGAPRLASEEKGQVCLDIYVQALARQIKTVKNDTEAPRLQEEYLQKVRDKGAKRN